MSIVKAKKGFTLIELLVVVAIIGLLATLAIISLGTARSKARDAKRIADIKSMQSALELYSNDNAGYPLEAVAVKLGVDKTYLCSGGAGAITPGFKGAACDATQTALIASVPKDPASLGVACAAAGAEGCDYAYTGTATSYKILFFLKNKTGSLDSGINCASQAGIVAGAAC